MFYVEIHTGNALTGDSAVVVDLTEDQLRDRFIVKRDAGEEVWVQGKPYAWNDTTTLRIYEGPPSSQIPDFSKLLGLLPHEASGAITERTDDFIHGPPGGTVLPRDEEAAGTAVFLVHGSDARREEVARFLEQLLPAENRAVVLHEQPNRGQTLIEKFEANAADARFAVVLLTGDDEGKRKGQPNLEPRGRQNVVFELGFFFGKLGRARVAVLYESGVALPSDVDGLVYIELVGDGWRLKLAKELRDSGLAVDLNRL